MNLGVASYYFMAYAVYMHKNSPSEYINQFSGEMQIRLKQIREIIVSEAPDAEEGIMYGLVGYKLNKKPLVYFGGFAAHIGFYATSNGHAAFKDEFSSYKQGKGSVQLPLDQPLPIELIKKVVHFRKEEVLNG